MTKPVRRVVMGHDANKRTVIQSDGPARVFDRLGASGLSIVDVWSTTDTPATITASEPDPCDGPFSVEIPKCGVRLRFMDMPPVPPGAQPFMHRTPSIDYGVIIEGEMTMLYDDDQELVLKTGDVIIQRGTNHAWVNRSDRLCRVLFVIIGADFAPELDFDVHWPPPLAQQS